MSEPQHPHPQDTGTNADDQAPASARPVVQPAVSAAGHGALDSLAAVGARLAQLRESKNWSIDDVSARLKVSSAKLQALEAGDISHLPDTTFALGVIRSYAKMLGTDPAPFTQALRAEKGMPVPNLSMPASSGRDLPRGRVSLSLGDSGQKSRSWLWGIAAVIVALIALAMWHTNGGDSSAWLARLRATANSAAAGGNTVSATNGASGAVAQGDTAGSDAAAEGASATDEGQAATDNAASATPMPAPLPTAPVATSAAPLAAAPQAGSQPAAPAAVPAANKAASTPAVAAAASQSAVPAAGESVVAVHVTQDSWFSVRQNDGKELFSGLVQAGDSKEISGVGPFKVTVGNRAGLDSITLDGKPVDPSKYASAKGNVARMTLP